MPRFSLTMTLFLFPISVSIFSKDIEPKVMNEFIAEYKTSFTNEELGDAPVDKTIQRRVERTVKNILRLGVSLASANIAT